MRVYFLRLRSDYLFQDRRIQVCFNKFEQKQDYLGEHPCTCAHEILEKRIKHLFKHKHKHINK